MVGLVIFDIDGTLVKTNTIDEYCYVTALEQEFSLTKIDTDWNTYQTATDQGIFEEIFQRYRQRKPTFNENEQQRKSFLALLKEYHVKEPAHFAEIPGARKIINLLKKSQFWRIGFATGGWRESALFKLDCAGIDIGNRPLITSSEAHFREDIVTTCIEQSHLFYKFTTFDKVVSIGDALWDLRTATTLRIGFIGLNNSRQFSDFKKHFTIENYLDIPRFLHYLDLA